MLEALQKLAAKSPLLKTKNGTTDVVQRLSRKIDDVRLLTEVKQIVSTDHGVGLVAESAGLRQEHSFDHLIVAVQANQAAKIVDSLSCDEQEMLSSFKYENVPVVVHCDSGLMPPDRKRWATFNMMVSGDSAAMCSVWMNQFHAAWPDCDDVFQTINPVQLPASEFTIDTANLQRPVVDQDSLAAWELISKLNAQTDRKVWFCGSYASRGIPLLESGVKSAGDVCAAIKQM